MQRNSLFVLFLIVFLASSSAIAQSIDYSKCDITVLFGSYCCGVDRQMETSFHRFMSSQHNIVQARDARSFGHEGGYSLCLEVKDNQLDKAFEELLALFPESSKKGYVIVESLDGHVFQSSWE